MAVISYAQANEDVLLFDALTHVPAEAGFYIDVGANDPEKDSVTKLFMTRVGAARTPDINIQAVASNRPGEIVFHDFIGKQLGTVVHEYPNRYSALGKALHSSSQELEAVTLTPDLREARAKRDPFSED